MKMTSGTKAAVVPMRVPTIILVNGKIKTIRMINGILRIILITVLRTVNTYLFFKIPSALVNTKTTDMMIAKIVPKTGNKDHIHGLFCRQDNLRHRHA